MAPAAGGPYATGGSIISRLDLPGGPAILSRVSNNPPPLPPADVTPAPPPAKAGIPLAVIIIGAILLVGILFVAAIAGLVAPQLIRMRKKGDQVVAMNHGRTISLMMNEFADEYGSYPDRTTGKRLATESTLKLDGDTANDYFRQLVAAGIARSEESFFAKSAHSKHQPDHNLSGDAALAPGEVGFGYIMNGDQAIPGSLPEAVLAVTPLQPGGRGDDFDPDPLGDRAVVVKIDGSVELLPIRRDSKVVLGQGKTLLETGADTVWGPGVTPVVKAPKLR